MSDLPAALIEWRMTHSKTATPDQLVHFDELQMGNCLGQHDSNVAGELYRMNTQYEHELSNWTVCCEPCKEEIRSYWKERWDEYYSSVM